MCWLFDRRGGASQKKSARLMVLVDLAADQIPRLWQPLPFVDEDRWRSTYESLGVGTENRSLSWLVQTICCRSSSCGSLSLSNGFWALDRQSRQRLNQSIQLIINYPPYIGLPRNATVCHVPRLPFAKLIRYRLPSIYATICQLATLPFVSDQGRGIRRATVDETRAPSWSPSRWRRMERGAISEDNSPGFNRNAGFFGWPRSACCSRKVS